MARPIVTGLDLLILATYVICVSYVLYYAINSLDAQLTIRLDQSLLNQQLQEQNLQQVISLRFGLKPRYKLDELKDLTVMIENRSRDRTVYVDWDYSSFTDLAGRTRRVIRIPPSGLTFESLQSQMVSTIPPGRTLFERMTAEDILRRGEKGMEIAGLLIDFARLQQGSDADRKRFASFIVMKEILQFSVRLALRFSDPETDVRSRRYHLQCQFYVEKRPWTDAFPWNRV